MEDVYEEILRDHIFFSKNYMKSLQNKYQQVKGSNLACGDTITIYFNERQGTLFDISFEGNCCSLVKASASLMADELNGKTCRDVQQMYKNVEQLLLNDTYSYKSFDVLMRKLCNTPLSKPRHSINTCVLLPWKTMIKAIQKNSVSCVQLKRDFSLYLY